ncbi:MAG: hypothetical protein EPN30_06965 [Actinomycetota bacterium]|nr:MAG: hypothetical protein EPN30_06965 [Actinomycetota bacterium]
MRIHKITLTNFRGVEKLEVMPELQGVTVIEADNEKGKTSITEAMTLLLDELDSSTKSHVRAIKPVDRDVGSEVEMEFTTGPYHVVFAKRWHRSPMTTLQVLAPRPENLTGRPAHERVTAMLAETADEALLRALRWEQGQGITQADLLKSASLTGALDAAASGSLGGDVETGLWELVQEERSKYWTATGKPVAARTELAERVRGLETQLLSQRKQLEELEAAADQHREIRLQLQHLDWEERKQRNELTEQDKTWKALEQQAREVELLKSKDRETLIQAKQARSANQARKDLIQEVAKAEAAVKKLKAEIDREAPRLLAAHSARNEAKEHLDVAKAARETAEEAARRARDDREHLHLQLDLIQLKERHKRIVDAEMEIRAANDELEKFGSIDDKAITKIEAEYLALAQARARAEAEAPTVQLSALQPIEINVNGDSSKLDKGESRALPVEGELKLSLGNLAIVTIRGGNAEQGAMETVHGVEAKLDELYKAIGVTDSDDPYAMARTLNDRRKEAERQREAATETIKRDVRDLTPQLIQEKITQLTTRVSTYFESRATDHPLPESLEKATAIAKNAEAAEKKARNLEQLCQEELNYADNVLTEAKQADTNRSARLELLDATTTTEAAKLEEARGIISDADLDAGERDADTAAIQARECHSAAEVALGAQRPDVAKELLENAIDVLNRTVEERNDREKDLVRVKALLELRGQAGLHDQLAETEMELEHATHERDSIERRARAAELLHRTLARHRDLAIRSYVRPFQQQLEGLAAIVFAPDVSFEIDHQSLQVVSRTMGGKTVPWSSLSGGAREQLCVLQRLAASALVSGDGGTPVILDDALGFSDPRRLQRLGAAFAVAAKTGQQVLVFTCQPDRYRHIGRAKLIRLGEELADADQVAFSSESNSDYEPAGS